MFNKNVFGVDLGSSAVKIYSMKKNRMIIEHNMIAIRNGSQVIAVGNDGRVSSKWMIPSLAFEGLDFSGI